MVEKLGSDLSHDGYPKFSQAVRVYLIPAALGYRQHDVDIPQEVTIVFSVGAIRDDLADCFPVFRFQEPLGHDTTICIASTVWHRKKIAWPTPIDGDIGATFF